MKGHNLGGISCKKCGKLHINAFLGHTKGVCKKCGKVHSQGMGMTGHNYGGVPCRKCGKLHVDGISNYIYSDELRRRMAESQRGRKHSEETKRKMGKAQLGRICSDETKAKLRKSHLGRTASDETKRRISEAVRGRVYTPEQKKKSSEAISKANRGKVRTPAMNKKLSERTTLMWKDIPTRTKIINSMRATWKNPLLREKASTTTKKQMQNPKVRDIMSKKVWHNDKVCANLSERTKKLWREPHYRQEVTAAMKRDWADPVQREKRIRNTLIASHIRPTSPEQWLIDAVQKYSLPYTYTGNGKVIISGYNPDFVNNDGVKAIVEVHGNYWHKNKEAHDKKRLDAFAELGYSSLVIWEHEINKARKDKLEEENLVQRIIKFTNDKQIAVDKEHTMAGAAL